MPDRSHRRIDRIWKAYARSRNEQLRNLLIEHYMPHVRTIARRLRRLPASVQVEDLESAAAFGLMHAIEGFDPSRNTRFTTFSIQRIRGAMVDELRGGMC